MNPDGLGRPDSFFYAAKVWQSQEKCRNLQRK